MLNTFLRMAFFKLWHFIHKKRKSSENIYKFNTFDQIMLTCLSVYGMIEKNNV